MDLLLFSDKAAILLVVTIFTAGVATIFLRRHAVWSLVGQLTAVKAVAAAAFLISEFQVVGKADLAVISLVALAMVPALGFVGLLALHRCGRFRGTLDYDEEGSLRD